jgi:hypothetical protein
MSIILTTIDAMIKDLDSAKEQAIKFEEKGTGSAGSNLRKIMQRVKVNAQEVRNTVQEIKNKAKEAK